MEATIKAKNSYPIWLTCELYNEIKAVRHTERKDTIKETAEEIVMLGLAVKRGEYVRAESVETI